MPYKLVVLVALAAVLVSPTSAPERLLGGGSPASQQWCGRFPAWPGCS